MARTASGARAQKDTRKEPVHATAGDRSLPSVRPRASPGRSVLDLWILAGLLAATIAFFLPLALPGAWHRWIVAGDFSQQFFPFRAFEAQEWWHGRIPLWNPNMFGGHPFEADVQTAVFYPLALANALLWGWHGLPYFGLEGEVVVHTWLAGAFMYLLARRMTGSRLGGAVAGLAFGFSGFVTTYPAQQLPILETAVWLPLTVLGLHEATADEFGAPRLAWSWLLGASGAFGVAVLAGHTQTALFVAYATEGYLLFRLVRGHVTWPRAVAALAAFPSLAVLVAAVQVVPSLQLLQVSTRDEMDYLAAAHGYLVSALPQIFVPLWHGEKALSIGVAALFLAGIGAWASRHEPLVYWTVIGLVVIPLSTGGATPLFWLLYHGAPGWNLFRDQERVIYLFAFSGALLAGRGAAEVAARLRVGRASWWAYLAGAAGATALILTGLALVRHASTALAINLALDAVVLGLLAAILVIAGRRPGSVLLPVALAGLVLVEVFALNFGNNLSAVNPDPRPGLEKTAAYLRAYPEPFRIDSTSEAIFPSDYGALLGLPTVGGNTPFELRRVHELLTPDTGWRLWQILNVKFVIGDPAPTPGLKLVFEDHGLKTYQMGDSLPRAWAVRSVEVARTASEAKSLILAPGYHPGNLVVLENAPSIGPFVPGPRPDVKITRLSNQEVDVDATADGNAMLVLASGYYPGWQATRDGQPTPTFTANYVAMAFELPPGTHHYQIRYQPTAFYLGAAASALAVASIAAVALATPAGRTVALPILTFLGVLKRKRAEKTAPELARERAFFGLAAGILILAALGLRLHDLAVPNLTSDEWFMLRNHDEGVAWIIHQARTFEPHPLLYYLGLAGWIELTGRTEFALRFLSVIFGVVLVPALISLGRVVAGRRAGLAAGLLVAINPYVVAESQNARDYEMVVALSAIATLLLVRAVRVGSRRAWRAYGLAMFLALNTHYDAALVFASHLAFLGYIGLRALRFGHLAKLWNTWGKAALATVAVVAALFGSMVVYAWPGLTAYHGYFPTRVGLDHVVARTLATFSLGASAPVSAAIPFFGLAALGFARLAARRREHAVQFGLALGLPFALVGVLFLSRPMFDERYLIVLAPAFLVLVALGVDALAAAAWPLGVAAAIGIVALTATWIPSTFHGMLTNRNDYRAMVAWVQAYGQRSDPVVATGPGQAHLVDYYEDGARQATVLDQPALVQSQVPGLLAAHRSLWLVPYFQSGADLTALDLLGRTAALVDERYFVSVRAQYYTSTDGLPPTPASGTFGDAIDVASAQATAGPVSPGDAVAAELRLAVREPIATPKFSLRLLDSTGAVVAQHDVLLSTQPRLAPGDQVARLGLFVPLVLPPGPYRLALLLYRPSDGVPLPLATGTAAPDQTLRLSWIDVGTLNRSVPSTEYGVAALPTPVALAPGLSLLGHDPLPDAVTAGDWLSFRVLWQANQAPLPNLKRVVEFRDDQGQSVASETSDLLPGFPTSRWSAGEALAEPIRLQTPTTLPRGVYEVYLRAEPGVGPAARLGTIAVSAPDRAFTPPPVATPVGASFDGFASLLGLNRSGPSVAPGAAVDLTLVWAARGAADQPYTVFVHLLGPDGKVHGQVDRPPLGGGRPTDGWVGGEYLSDAYAPTVAPDAPAGTYQIEVGMYDPRTGARVPVTLADGSRADHVVVGTFQVGR